MLAARAKPLHRNSYEWHLPDHRKPSLLLGELARTIGRRLGVVGASITGEPAEKGVTKKPGIAPGFQLKWDKLLLVLLGGLLTTLLAGALSALLLLPGLLVLATLLLSTLATLVLLAALILLAALALIAHLRSPLCFVERIITSLNTLRSNANQFC